MKNLLWLGDAVCPSGFAVATHNILETLRHHYNVTVIGMNYNGDPHSYPYPIYLAGVGGDGFGVNRIAQIAVKCQADVIVVQQDGWNIPAYVQQLQKFEETRDIPVVAAVAVDGKNFNGQWLRGVKLAIFWTQFALDEARAGGYRGPAQVITLGVDLDIYKPLDKMAVRKTHDPALIDVVGNENNFIIGCVGRNQPRKRWDLTIKYFAKWIEDENIQNAWLYMHAAPTGDVSVNVIDLSRYYNCLDRTVYIEPPVFVGLTEEQMCKTYNCFDVYISTTQGEGMGLPALEAMACGVPCLLPDWSAFGDWARYAADLVPCTTTRVDFPYQNVIGGVADEGKFIEGLDQLYRDTTHRKIVAQRSLDLAREDKFRWQNIGEAYVRAIDDMLALKASEKSAQEEAQDKARRDAEEDAKRKEASLERKMQILRGEVSA